MKTKLKQSEETITKYSIHYNANIEEAMKLMDRNKSKLLIVNKSNRFYNVLSIGDIQRALLNKIELNRSIEGILRDKSKVKIARSKDSIEEVKNLMLRNRMEFIPVINVSGCVEDILFWDDFFDGAKRIEQRLIDVPVVIMAGGYGTRLKPLTNIIPKPLLPIGDEPIVTEIMKSFKSYGASEFTISINHMGDVIKSYFDSNPISGIELKFIEEKSPLGTAGSLHLLKDQISDTFFVSNCDIIIDQDFGEVYEFHKKSGNMVTIVAALKSYNIQYGTLNISSGGFLTSISEKPKLDFVINTGVYILEPAVLNFIPKDSFYHITHLIEDLMRKDLPVGVFPISENSWTDIGEFDSYLSLIRP